MGRKPWSKATMKPIETIDEDVNDEDALPIPLQIFLWRQSMPFLRPRLGRAHDTSCMFCQRAPGHHSFEKVLVQNLRSGLSESLSDAITAVPRWRMIQGALPHVMHSLATLLHNRVKDNMISLGTVETKLFYTLHWILLDASDECADFDYESGVSYSKPFHYLFSIPTITLFVYLFAPLSQHLKESDFANYRLENGLKIWGSMWEFRHPDAACFNTRVKPQPKPLGSRPHGKSQPVDVFLGRKFSKEDAASPPSQGVAGSQWDGPSKQFSDDEPWVSSPKDTVFPETIPEESSSNEDDHLLFIYRLPSDIPEPCIVKESDTLYSADPSLFQYRKGALKQLPNIGNFTSSERGSLTDSGGAPDHKDYPHEKSVSLKLNNVSAATFLDVATLKCLFATQWQEEGVYWALHYLYNRLRDISEDMSRQIKPRKRSNSLPIPKIEVSIYQSPELKKRDSLKNFIEVPELKETTPVTEPLPQEEEREREKNVIFRRASEKVKKKMKMCDLRAFVETKLLSKSEKALENVGQEDSKFTFNTAEYHRSLEGADPNAGLANTFPPMSPRGPDLLQCNLVKGKSMPSLRHIGEIKIERARGVTTQSQYVSHRKMNPIITVTEHTPTPSPDFLSKNKQGSIESQIDSVSMQGSQHLPTTPERKPSLSRSQTDSNITYLVEEIQEAVGSTHYITKDGEVDIKVVLKAVFSVSTMDSHYLTLRVMEVMLNLVDTLMEMGILKQSKIDKQRDDPAAESNQDKKNNSENKGKDSSGQPQVSTNMESGEPAKEKDKEEDLKQCPCYMIFEIIFRVMGELGCGLGCPGAVRGPAADVLRALCARALTSLRAGPKAARALKLLVKVRPPPKVLPALHALLGYCADPSIDTNGQKRPVTKLNDLASLRAAYASNFGGKQNQGNDIWILDTCGQLLISRLATMQPKLSLSENSTVCSEVRQLVVYWSMAGAAGWRAAALQPLLHARPAARPTPRKQEEDRGSDTGADSAIVPDDKHHKKFAFKKRSVSSMGVHSVWESESGCECGSPPRSARRTTRPAPALCIVRWVRTRRGVGTGVGSGRGGAGSRGAATHTVAVRVVRTLHRAKKHVEDKLNRFGFRKMGKNRDGSIEETMGGTAGGCSGGPPCPPRPAAPRLLPPRLRAGLARFSLLLNTTQPGELPDALFAAALLDLPFTVVVARAAYLMEMAHLVHNCNKGHWPAWLKAPPHGMKHNVALSPQLRRQRLAGKLFHQWAESIGNRLEEMLVDDRKCMKNVESLVNDPEGQRELLRQDEEEDFLDEESIRIRGKPIGHECPRALRLVACVLLYEITAFLRETYQNLPKNTSSSLKEKGPWERVYREANRRWSMALSSMGHSQASAQSLQSIAGEPERKISFALHEPENGSNNALVEAASAEKNRSQAARGKARRGFGSVKRRSIKLRQKDTNDDFINKRSDSIQSRRKVSTLSDRSDTSEQAVYTGIGGGAETESGGEDSVCISDDPAPDSPPHSDCSNGGNGAHTCHKTIVKFLHSFNYTCTHQNFCHPYCFRRNMRAAARLMKAVQIVYGEPFGSEPTTVTEGNVGGGKKRARSRKTSEADRKDSVQKDPKSWIDKSATESEGIPSSATTTAPDPPPILKYLKTQVKDAHHSPLATLIKGAIVLPEDVLSSAAQVAWELLLENDREVSSCAAALFILAAVRTPQTTMEIMNRHLKHEDANVRVNAILRFQVMWRMRYQVWCRMEEGAATILKVPPPGIEFTLPSPKIGIEALSVVDPPWEPDGKDKDMEMTLNQERHRSLVTATKTRKKQQTEAIKKALQQRNDKKKAERESFLLSSVPILREAGREAAGDHALDDHVDGVGAEEEGEVGRGHTAAASALFPSALVAPVSILLELLDDSSLQRPTAAVYQVAYQVIWNCLVEDSALFLRHVLERLTRDHQDEMFKSLRHLIRFIPRLPHQAAFALYNYIIGYVMFYVRTPHEDGQKLIGSALSILWMVVHSVHGIMFKDLKQILRKEQCDAAILLTANVPAAKKIIVHGPPDNEGYIPSQFPVQEDTQFSAILREAIDFFSIPEHLHHQYFLVDFKTRQIHNPQSYVRDFYFFKRSQYPQLGLVQLAPEEALLQLQKREMLHKSHEIGKVLLTWAILKNVDMVVQRVVFLHEELMKLPSFPRKALESSLELYSHGPLGATLRGLDVLHKFMWVRLIARMFEAMAGNFSWSRDIHLFLNVLNGALMLHSEDSFILRYVIATYVNAAFNFKNIFSTNGYLLIMPTLLQIYSNYQTNKLITTTIEYAVKQFYLLNRKPFILQMFGSVSALLDTDEEAIFGDASKVQSSCLFNLLLSLETPSPDPLHIAELIKEEKPLKPIDFCYRDEDEMVNVLDCISLCVMVVSYAAESVRGYQMLVILEAILPCYVKQIQLPTYNREGRTEKEIIYQLAIAIRTLVNNCEGLSKTYNGPYRTSPEHKPGSSRMAGGVGGSYLPGGVLDDDSRMPSDHTRVINNMHLEDSELVRAEYRRPRDVLLSLVGEFIGKASARLLELNGSKGSGGSEGKSHELLDHKSHVRLSDIAHSLLKVSPYDPESMGCRGLQRYMTLVLPSADWGEVQLRQALTTILRRLDKVFMKIAKKPSIRKNTDWDAAAVLLKGIYETMARYPYLMHWPQFKTLLNTVQSLIVSDCSEGGGSGTAGVVVPPPPHFCSTLVRLLALHLTTEGCSLEQMCGGSAVFPSVEKTETMLMNLFMPLCLRVGSGRKDVPPLRQTDISYIVSVVTSALSPRTPPAAGPKLTDARTNSLTFSRDTRRPAPLSDHSYWRSFTALKVVCTCFPRYLSREWGRIARCVRDVSRRTEASRHVWNFLMHVATHRSPLYILLLPTLHHKVYATAIGEGERALQLQLRGILRNAPPPPPLHVQLYTLAQELRDIRDQVQFGDTAPVATAKRPSECPRADTHAHKHRQSLVSIFAWNKPRTPDRAHAQRESLSSGSAELLENRRPSDINNIVFSTNSSSNNTLREKDEKPTLTGTSNLSLQNKLRFGSSVEVKVNSAETSSSPLSPLSPGANGTGGTGSAGSTGGAGSSTGGAGSGTGGAGSSTGGAGSGTGGAGSAGTAPRLQRSQGPSKRTFKFRRANQHESTELTIEAEDSDPLLFPQSPPSHPSATTTHIPLTTFTTLPTTTLMSPITAQMSPITTLMSPITTQMSPTTTHLSPINITTVTTIAKAILSPVASANMTAAAIAAADLSWDSSSQISQTSSTCGYRDSLQISAFETEAASSQHEDEGSLSCDSASSSAGRTALVGTLSQRTLVFGSDTKDEDTLL